MVKLRATMTFEYEADPVFYSSSVPEEMAAIDQEAGRDDWQLLFDGQQGTVVTVEVVKDAE